uniref:Uncharacterized protein n=1 Tax=Bionectria ochroleuca TaxID=29856 RepID=A0A0B7JU74_BIOOC
MMVASAAADAASRPGSASAECSVTYRFFLPLAERDGAEELTVETDSSPSRECLDGVLPCVTGSSRTSSARRREGIRVRSGLARDSGGLSIDCLVRPFRCCFCWNKELASLSWHFVLDIPRRIQVGCGVPLFSPATRHLESIRNFQRIEARDRVCGFVREIMSNSLGQQAHISDNTATVATEVVRDPTPMSDPCRGCTSSNWRNVTLLTRMTAGPWK